MRAPFDTTCTLYTGPGTASPYAVRIAGAPCRLVEDPYFRDTRLPLSQSSNYFTILSLEPNGPATTDGGGGVWSYNYALADRVEFAVQPGILWICADVLSCTGPQQAPYWRSELIETEEVPLTVCQRTYASSYEIQFSNGSPTVRVYRIGPTIWTAGGVILQAEATGSPGLGCDSTWIVLGGLGAYQGTWNGNFATVFPKIGGGGNAYIAR